MFFKYTGGNDQVPPLWRKGFDWASILTGATKGVSFSGNDNGMEWVWVAKSIVDKELRTFKP